LLRQHKGLLFIVKVSVVALAQRQIEVFQSLFHNMAFMGIKRRRILCRFQKYKPYLSHKMHIKKIFQEKEFRLPRVVKKFFILEYLLGAFCH
jgi:hypothetical protein